jgi:hypothetical protein
MTMTMTSVPGRTCGWLAGLVSVSLLLAALWVASCAHSLPEGGGFRVDCNLTDATVLVDDVPVGNTSGWKADGRQIRAGFHRVEIRRPGYYSVFREIDLPVGGQAVVVAKLRETVE